MAGTLKYPFFYLVLITLIVYCPTLLNDFQCQWDDQWILLDNPFVTDGSLSSAIYHFKNFYGGQYSPVNTYYYKLVYELFGFSPMAFHAASLVVHIGTTLLVYCFISKLIALMKPGYAQKRVMIFAFVTALVFAVHPLQVEAVAWASASKIVMYAFFVVLACCAYLKYTDSGSFLWLSVVMLLYLVAFACKEQAIIFPLNLVVLDYALGRFKKQNMGRGMLFSKVVLEKIPFFAVALLLWYFSYQNNLGGFQSPAYPFSQRIFIGAHSFVMYIYRFLAPVKLYYYYFYPMAPGDAVPAAYGIYLLLSLLVFIFFIYHFRHKNKVLATGFLFFLVNILLVLHVLPMPRGYATADRFMYLGITGCTLSLCWIVQYVWSKYQKLRGLLLSTITVFLVLIALHSFFRVARWKDSTALKKEVKELLENRKKNDINTNSNIQNR